jgi:hypothetical protein
VSCDINVVFDSDSSPFEGTVLCWVEVATGRDGDSGIYSTLGIENGQISAIEVSQYV